MSGHALTLGLLGAAAGVVAADKYTQAFEEFVAKFQRNYATEEEREQRFEVFSRNLDIVEAENAKQDDYHLEINGFADQTLEEFGSSRLGLNAPPQGQLWSGLPFLGEHKYSGAALPSDVDWVSAGAVTPVKNQGHCGSCWSFSTTGAVEGAYQIASGRLESFSEQQLVDCSHDGNAGCSGGSMPAAFQYLESHPMCSETEYGYQAVAGTCRESQCTAGLAAGEVTGYKAVTQDDAALQEAIAQQPVSVAIQANQTTFQLYGGGVLKAACGDALDHGVLAVGYGTDESGVNYWKVKNSWGGAWGEQGYIRLERGSHGAHGQCGILMMSSYPVVSPHGPAPGPAPAPAPGTSTHYGKPPCMSDEVLASIGSGMSLCAPRCSWPFRSCPSDVPAGATGTPQCVLRTADGTRYCALTCTSDASCGAGATCSSGVCSYPQGLLGDAMVVDLEMNDEGVVV